MSEPAYFHLSEVERIFAISRDSLTRWARAGIFVIQGENKGRRVTGVSVRAAYARQEKGEDLWLVVKAHEETRVLSAAKPMAKVRSIKIKEVSGGTNLQQKTDSESPAFEPLVSNPQSPFKRII